MPSSISSSLSSAHDHANTNRPTRNLNFHMICPLCKDKHPNLVEDCQEGDIICADCGYVLAERVIDTTPEWRRFADDDDGDNPSRVGLPEDTLLKSLGLTQVDSTAISFSDRRSKPAAVALSKSHQTLAGMKADKVRLAQFRQLSATCERLDLSKLIEDSAKQFLTLAITTTPNILKRFPLDILIASCIFLGCRAQNVARSVTEIANATNTPFRKLGHCFKFIQQLEFPKAVTTQAATAAPAQHLTSSITASLDSMIHRMGPLLNLDFAALTVAGQVANRVQYQSVLAGKTTKTLLGASLYFATALSDTPKSMREIAAAVGCAEGTIRTAYKSLFQAREALFVGLNVKKGLEDLPRA